MTTIRRALLSVYNKKGIVPFARGLQTQGVELIASGGTYALLHQDGIPVSEVSSYTGSPEILGGRVKTLHPMIHGGILAKRDKHQEEMARHGIRPIDLVAVNLYPFRETIAKPSVTLDEALENIDIGGPTMLRAAAKNYKDVLVLVDPNDYAEVLDAISKDAVTESLRRHLAEKVFCHTADYDTAISAYLLGHSDKFPDRITLGIPYVKAQTLRYGENPHQEAVFYKSTGALGGWGEAKILWGKEMSYNNFLDADSALHLVSEFHDPAAVVLKHNNPCGVAMGKDLLESLKMAKAADPVSAFGGVVAVNRPITKDVAEEIVLTFMEVVIAPAILPDALDVLKSKKNLRVLTVSLTQEAPLQVRSIAGGLLLQGADQISGSDNLKVVTKREPTQEEIAALRFAETVCKHVRSNAIVLAKGGVTLGIGAGQMSRVDSVQIALTKAKQQVSGAVMASDAFFPFRDTIDLVGKTGIKAVIQPGGSIRDEEVIAAANEYNLAMVFTGIRHFRH